MLEEFAGSLARLPILGIQTHAPNTEWTIYSSECISYENGAYPKPELTLHALSTEWAQSLTKLQMHFGGGLDSSSLQSKCQGKTYHRSLISQTQRLSAITARINQSSGRIYDIGFQYDGKTNVI